MSNVQTGSTVHDVVIIGSGAGGGTVTKVLADLGVNVLLIEAGPMVAMTDFKMLHGPYDVWHRGAGERAQLYTTGQGTPLNFNASFAAEHHRRAVHRGAGQPVPLVPIARASAAARTTTARVQLRYSDYDFKPQSMRRARLGLADQLRGHGAVLRQGRALHRRHRQGRKGMRSAPDGIFQEPAPLKAHEVLLAARVREARHPRDQRAAGGDHEPAQRPPGVPLLRAMRPRLLAGFELRVELRADLPGDEDRAA